MSRKKSPSTPLLWAEEPAPLAAAHDRFLAASQPVPVPTGPETKRPAVVADAIARSLRHRLPWLASLTTFNQLALIVRQFLPEEIPSPAPALTFTLEDLCECYHTTPEVAATLREKLPPGWQIWTDFTVALIKVNESLVGRIPLE